MLKPIKATKRPITVTCIQYDGENLLAVKDFVGSNNFDPPIGQIKPRFWVAKSGVWVELQEGMWVMAEPDGSGFYPCSGEAFIATYDRMES